MVTHPRFYNDEWTIQDDLEFESLKKVLVKLINSRYTQTPITVGIHGAWGTGKTTLMRMVHKEIKKDNKVIWFDAWKFREIDDVWKGLIIEVLTQIGIKKNLKEKAKKLSVKLLRIGGIALVNKITNMNKDEIDSVINSVFENDMKSFRNEQKEFEQLIDDIKQRDQKDSERKISPLKIAEDATVIDTSGMDFNQQITKIKKHIEDVLSI